MWSIFKKKPKQIIRDQVPDFSFLACDMHSHFIPGIDDGAQNAEESLDLIRGMVKLGYKKIITTPHVYGEFYNNEGHAILDHYVALKKLVVENEIPVELEVAAEYFLDLHFKNEVLPRGLLSFGGEKKFVLVEVSMMGWPRIFDEIIFEIQSNGYHPVLAHPERYSYETDPSFYLKLKDRGVLAQLNTLSICGYYGKSIQNLALKYLDAGVYDFCGSDAHHLRHQEVMHKIIANHQDMMLRLKEYPGFRNQELLEL